MRVLPYGLISATGHLRGKLHKNKVFQIANSLLVIDIYAKNIHGNTTRMVKTIETKSSAIKQLLKSMFLVMNTSLASP